MTLEEVMMALKSLSSERIKKYYLNQGAKEPLFGAGTGAMKPLAKRIKNDQAMAEALYGTGNYDAMYLAGMIANVSLMTPEDFDRWMESAYFYMISDFIVAVTLSETIFAQEVADRYIQSDLDLVQSAGWSTYEWLLGSRADIEFDSNKIEEYLNIIRHTFNEKPERTQRSMKRFLIAVGVSYAPLHEEALQTAKAVEALSDVALAIEKEISKGRLGFKRKHVRC